MAAERAGLGPGGQGKAIPVEETAVQLSLPIATAKNPKGATRRKTRDRLGAVRAGAPKAIGTTGTAAPATMEEVAKRLTSALLKVASNKGAPGPDGQTTEALCEQWPFVLPRLQADLLEGTYRPGVIRRRYIPKAGVGSAGWGFRRSSHTTRSCRRSLGSLVVTHLLGAAFVQHESGGSRCSSSGCGRGRGEPGRRARRGSDSCSHTSRPFPLAWWSGRLAACMGEWTISDALDDGQLAAVGGRFGRWRGRLSGLRRAAVAMGVRALARGADASRRPLGHAAAGVLPSLWRHARARSLVVGPAPARWRGGDRRSASAGRAWRGASPDRASARTPAGHGPWVVAHSQGAGAQPTGVRGQVGVRVGSRRAERGDPGRQRAGRRGRGDDARRQGMRTAVRSRPSRPVGASGVPHRRAAVRPATAAALALRRGRAPARPHRHPAAHGGCESSAAAAPACPPSPSSGA